MFLLRESPWKLLPALAILILTACGSPFENPPGEAESRTEPTTAAQDNGVILRVHLKGAITPSSLDRLGTALEKAQDRQAKALLVVLDTPGGLMSSMDDMIRLILASSVPVISYVSPPGAYCGSAGVYIMYASHVAAMSPATNIGSATPVTMGGGGTPGQQPRQPDKKTGGDQIPDEAGADDAVNMKRKLMNHAVAQIRGLAEFHGRNVGFAERAVTRAENITSSQALAIGAIDMIASTEGELLEKLEGRRVRMMTETRTLNLKGASVETLESDFRSNLLAIIANPSVSYILMMIGILGILAEVQYPGSIFPGVVGAICLLLGLYAMQSLPVDYTGFALIGLGILLFIMEIKMLSYGLLTVAGIICFILGSILLVRTGNEFTRISLTVIFTTSVLVGGTMGFLIYKAGQVMRRRPSSGEDQLLTEIGTVQTDVTGTAGRIYVHSEYWSARTRAAEPIPRGTKVRITEREGMLLFVEPVPDQAG